MNLYLTTTTEPKSTNDGGTSSTGIDTAPEGTESPLIEDGCCWQCNEQGCPECQSEEDRHFMDMPNHR